MPRLTLSLSTLPLVFALSAQATFPATPLADLRFPTPSDAPEHADPGGLVRGNQFGYNRCGSETENQDSRCQTAFVNDLGDFCLFAPPFPNSTIGDSEGEEIAWCTKAGHGTRLMPRGTLLAVQVLKAPDYVLVTGLLKPQNINIREGDGGGELDPHGQDLRGNPIGGLVYSTQFSQGQGPRQVPEWTSFMENDLFCFKICDPAGGNQPGYCQNRLDRLGCEYNAPSRFTTGSRESNYGVFETCDSENMDVPGVYVHGGQTLSYAQPEGPITRVPYEPRVPKSSNCIAATGTAIYTDVPNAPQRRALPPRALSASGFVTSRVPAIISSITPSLQLPSVSVDIATSTVPVAPSAIASVVSSVSANAARESSAIANVVSSVTANVVPSATARVSSALGYAAADALSAAHERRNSHSARTSLSSVGTSVSPSANAA